MFMHSEEQAFSLRFCSSTAISLAWLRGSMATFAAWKTGLLPLSSSLPRIPSEFSGSAENLTNQVPFLLRSQPQSWRAPG